MPRRSVLVIGGGIAGVSVAAELAADHEVTVLEAEPHLATHSTGRSAALFLTGYGPPVVQALTRGSEELFRHLELAPGAPPLLAPRGLLLTAWDEGTVDELRMSLNAPNGDRREVKPAEAGTFCPALLTDELQLAVLDRTARDIDVMALHAAYVRIVRERGGNLHCNAAVSAAHRLSSGWQVMCHDGRCWQADIVINAAGAWADDVALRCGVSPLGLSPRRRTIVISRPQTLVDAGWPVIAEANEDWYFKPEGQLLLLSPGDETPMQASDVRPDPLDIAATLERVNGRTTFGLRSVHTAWAGLRTFAPDRAPVVGPHPDEPSLHCLVGQGGYGIQTAPALARIAADQIRGDRTDDADDWLLATIDPRRLVTQAALFQVGQIT